MNKSIYLGAAAFIIAYFIFFYDSFPQNIEFRDKTYTNKKDVNDTLHDNFVAWQYYSPLKSQSLIFLKEDSNDIEELKSIRQLYINSFEHQGVQFEQSGNRYLGSFKDESILITMSDNLNMVVMYAEKTDSPENRSIVDLIDLYRELESINI